MTSPSKISIIAATVAGCAIAASSASAQQLEPVAETQLVVNGQLPSDLSGLEDGPELDGFISARAANAIQVTTPGGEKQTVWVSPDTKIKAAGGFLGLSRKALDKNALLNGLPVSVETVQWNGELVASEIALKNKDLKTAAMIRNGTAQRFSENEQAIDANTAVAAALRSRVGDIDKYNIKGTTNVYFDSGKWRLSPGAKRELCSAANQADGMDNALLLVVGYTDSDGSQEFNQQLSEKRAGGVVNHLQQACGWKPWRMLTPTGMSEADPLADNSTAAGKAQNRRVAVNILVSKSVDGI